MDRIDFVLLCSRWIHLSAAIVAIGGVTFLRFVLLPSARAVLDEEGHRRLQEAVRTRWMRFVHACIALLLLTGLINFTLLALPAKVRPLPYYGVFGVKLLAALVVFFVGSVLVGRSQRFEKMRRKSTRWLAVITLLAALIVLLSGVLGQMRTRAPRASDSDARVLSAGSPVRCLVWAHPAWGLSG